MIKFLKELNTVIKPTAGNMISGEWDLIKIIKAQVNSSPVPAGLIKGIGDDCAVYQIDEKRYGLFSTDVSVEDIHFRTSYCSFNDIGFRSMAANISDILAMGGTPLFVLSAITVPAGINNSNIEEIYRGMLSCASPYGVSIAGGDISKGRDLSLSISIYGETDNPVYRSGASQGDYIYITGDTGRSKAGLEILMAGGNAGKYPSLTERHLRPTPFMNIKMIKEIFRPTSMIDISDGIISDIKHICAQSRKGFSINCDRLTLHDELEKYCNYMGKESIPYALSSGEEYELLFTSQKIAENIDGVTLIGEITESGEIYTRSGIEWIPPVKGYEHFKKAEG
jgi:thiamine-monophosphate kinase